MEIQEKVCRTCLKGDKELFPLDVKLENELSGKKMLEYLIGFDIPDSEAFCEICEYCRTTLIASYIFKQQCLVSEEKIKFFLKYIDENDQKCLGGDFMDPLFVDAGLPVKSEECPSPPAAIPEMESAMEPAMEPAIEPEMESDVEPTAPPTPEITTKGKPEKPKMLADDVSAKLTEDEEEESLQEFPTDVATPKKSPAKPTKRQIGKNRSRPGRDEPKDCRKCNITFPDHSSYRKHYRLEHEEKRSKTYPVACRQCDIQFPNMQAYGKHYVRVHKVKKPPSTETAICEDCGKVVRAQTLKSHRVSHAEKSFFCPICNEGFKSESSRTGHLRIHNQEKRFKCEYCNESFVHGNSRNNHIVTHHERDKHQKKFECHICQQKFYWKNNLTTHIRNHIGDFRHECSYCKKRFVTNHLMKMHLVTHTGVKNVMCSICDKAFGTKGSLRQHMVTHSNVKNYQCEFCKKSFTYSQGLRNHLRDHHPEHPMPPPGTVLKKASSRTKNYLTRKATGVTGKVQSKTKNRAIKE